jgi:hypothetical protein
LPLRCLSSADVLIALYTVPTVCTCRSEQWTGACTRLGVTPTLPTAVALANNEQDGGVSGSHRRSKSARIAGSGGSGGESSLSSGASLPLSNNNSGGGGPGGGHLTGSQLQNAPSNSFLGPGLQGSMGLEESSQLAAFGFGGSSAAPQHLQAMPMQSTGNVGPPGGLGASFHGGGGAMGGSARAAGVQAHQHVNPHAAEVKEWCHVMFSKLGLARGLSQDDLEVRVAGPPVMHPWLTIGFPSICTRALACSRCNKVAQHLVFIILRVQSHGCHMGVWKMAINCFVCLTPPHHRHPPTPTPSCVLLHAPGGC